MATFDEWWEKQYGPPPRGDDPGPWVAAKFAWWGTARAAWDAATAAERDRQEQHRADVRNYLKAPLEGHES